VRGGRQKPGMPQPSKVNWDFLERRIASSDKAYQRQIIRKKIDELVQYYEQCRQARDLPSIPGAVIISCDERLSFSPADTDSPLEEIPVHLGWLRHAWLLTSTAHRRLCGISVTQHLEAHEFVDVTGRERSLVELHAKLLHPNCGDVDHRFESRTR